MEDAIQVQKVKKNKFKEFIKKNRKILILIAAAALILLVGVMVLVYFINNNFKSPAVKKVKALNMRNDYEDNFYYLNGFCEKELKTIMKLSDNHNNHNVVDSDIYELEYGNDFKLSGLKIEYKEEYDSEKLEIFKKKLTNYSGQFKEFVSSTENYKRKDWKKFAEEHNMSVSEAKKFVRMYKRLAKKIEKCEITKGYSCKYKVKVKGMKVEKGTTAQISSYVVKINGKWVDEQQLSTVILACLLEDFDFLKFLY